MNGADFCCRKFSGRRFLLKVFMPGASSLLRPRRGGGIYEAVLSLFIGGAHGPFIMKNIFPIRGLRACARATARDASFRLMLPAANKLG